MHSAKGPTRPDLIADAMSFLFPLVLCGIILLVLADSFACHVSADEPDLCTGAGGRCNRESLIEAARELRLDPGVASMSSPMDLSEASGFDTNWLGDIWREHRYHFLSVFLMEETEYLYTNRVGPPKEPRFFENPGSLDENVFARFDGQRDATTFVARHKDEVIQATALGAVVLANGRDGRGLVNDAIGLVEASKFAWATSSFVKTFVGRPRPAHAGLDDEHGARISRDSFPSDSASTAFTFMAYADAVVARRLEDRPWTRALSATGFYGLASYVAYTRVEQGRHYVTDVVAGAGIGFAVGRTFHRIHHEVPDGDEEPRVRFAPLFVPGGAGISMTIRLARTEPKVR